MFTDQMLLVVLLVLGSCLFVGLIVWIKRFAAQCADERLLNEIKDDQARRTRIACRDAASRLKSFDLQLARAVVGEARHRANHYSLARLRQSPQYLEAQAYVRRCESNLDHKIARNVYVSMLETKISRHYCRILEQYCQRHDTVRQAHAQLDDRVEEFIQEVCALSASEEEQSPRIFLLEGADDAGKSSHAERTAAELGWPIRRVSAGDLGTALGQTADVERMTHLPRITPAQRKQFEEELNDDEKVKAALKRMQFD